MIFDDTKINPNNLSPITLAFVGDAVYSLIVREELALTSNKKANELHKICADTVSAVSQCEAIKSIMENLSEEEKEVFRRGRNAATSHTPKNASSRDYHYATGFETLLGWLYLSRKYDRIKEIYSLICQKSEQKK